MAKKKVTLVHSDGVHTNQQKVDLQKAMEACKNRKIENPKVENIDEVELESSILLSEGSATSIPTLLKMIHILALEVGRLSRRVNEHS